MQSTTSPSTPRAYIPAMLYKGYASTLSLPIRRIYGTSLKTGKLPEGIALAIVKALDKGSDKCEPFNFCQSLQQTTYKLNPRTQSTFRAGNRS